MVADFAAIVKQAGEDYSPSIIANYTYDLVKEYNQFYHDFSILREENEAVKVFRLALSENVAKVVRLGMEIVKLQSDKDTGKSKRTAKAVKATKTTKTTAKATAKTSKTK